MDSTSQWHNIVWDEEKIGRFWNFISERDPWKSEFFSRQVGQGVVNFLKLIAPMKGDALDYGCGPGYLLGHLLAAGINCTGVDFSMDNVKAVNQRFRGRRSWKGARVSSGITLPYPDASFDLVSCLETIEHILPEKVPVLMGHLRRVLKPAHGMLFLTVPNCENLASKNVYCPECGSFFHHYQHVSSFNIDSLERLMTRCGFQTILCNVTDFDAFQRRRFAGLVDWSPRETLRWMRWAAALVMDVACRPGTPAARRSLQQRLGQGGHLFWLGTRN